MACLFEALAFSAVYKGILLLVRASDTTLSLVRQSQLQAMIALSGRTFFRTHLSDQFKRATMFERDWARRFRLVTPEYWISVVYGSEVSSIHIPFNRELFDSSTK